MNILLFLTPKKEVTLLYEDYTIGQALRAIENGGHPAVPIIRRSGERSSLGWLRNSMKYCSARFKRIAAQAQWYWFWKFSQCSRVPSPM